MTLSGVSIPSAVAKVFSLKPMPVAKSLPLEVGIIHLVGIGGIGISGIAEILHNLGYKVQGSDLSESPNVERLRRLGIEVFIGQDEQNVKNASVVVISSAVKQTNPEVVAARNLRIPVVRRSEMLAELMRLKISIAVAGTHGKTTTTSLLATLLDAGNLSPTVINGGIINSYGTNARVGSGDWMVVEADESDGTFIKIPASIAVITNIDPEHLDYWGSFDALRAAFRQFLDNLPFYGFAVLCMDHPEVQRLIAEVQDRRIISYGLSPNADVRAEQLTQDAQGQHFNIVIESPSEEAAQTISDMHFPMHGEHNLRNALAAIAVAHELGIPAQEIKNALKGFGGVKRRFTVTGQVDGITVVDDYGHHPTEIAATLKAARQAVDGKGKVVAVVQPHRYSRVESLFQEFCQCFNEADQVLVCDIYSAGEDPIEGISKDSLVKGMQEAGHRGVTALTSESELAKTIAEMTNKGDYVICLGAGSISKWANDLPEALKAYSNKQKVAS